MRHFTPYILRAKLILIAFCLVVVGASSLYLKGMDAGMEAIDQESFDAYTHFAKQMHPAHLAKAKTVKPAKDTSVWAIVDRN